MNDFHPAYLHGHLVSVPLPHVGVQIHDLEYVWEPEDKGQSSIYLVTDKVSPSPYSHRSKLQCAPLAGQS